MTWLLRTASRASARTVVVVAVAVAVVGGVLGLVPVRSQPLSLDAPVATETVPLDDPWDAVWDHAPALQVPLSAQNVSPPFGGGTIRGVTVRAQHDTERVYVLLEWIDVSPDTTVAGHTLFSDAAATQFPVTAAATPYTMGDAEHPVNIWQWKAVWQADIESGYQSRPDAVVDYYPHPDDPLYRPAEEVGNLNAQIDRTTPIEDLQAVGFGTLTTAETQQVAGSGEWREERWRVVFSRVMDTGDPGLARFEIGATTPVAFAIWDGNAGDRNGQKSIAQFVDVHFSAEPGPAAPLPAPEPGNPVWVLLVAVGLIAVVAAGLALIGRRRGSD